MSFGPNPFRILRLSDFCYHLVLLRLLRLQSQLKKIAFPPLQRKLITYSFTFSSMSLPKSSGLPCCKLTIDFSGDLLFFSESFTWFRCFLWNTRTVVLFKSENRDLNLRSPALQPVLLTYFAIESDVQMYIFCGYFFE